MELDRPIHGFKGGRAMLKNASGWALVWRFSCSGFRRLCFLISHWVMVAVVVFSYCYLVLRASRGNIPEKIQNAFRVSTAFTKRLIYGGDAACLLLVW